MMCRSSNGQMQIDLHTRSRSVTGLDGFWIAGLYKFVKVIKCRGVNNNYNKLDQEIYNNNNNNIINFI